MVTQEELEKMSPEEIAELQRQNCIFCKIIKGDIPSQTVLSNEYTQAVLDINPAQKGHVLVMPKEHVPILPILPPENFKKLFHDVKRLTQAVKEGVHAQSASVFVANGYAAGQQASHFLLHVISRDQGDALTPHFTLSQNPAHQATQQSLLDPLKKNIPIMLANHFKRLGGTPFPKETSPPISSISPSPAVEMNQMQPTEDQQEKLASFFEMYPQAKVVLKQDPSQFEVLLERVQPEIKQLFAGIDLVVLSEQFRKLDEQFASDEQLSSQEVELPVEPDTQQVQEVVAENQQPAFTAADIFKGADPAKQAHDIVAYFMSKPKAKELFQTNIDAFKALLGKREDIQPLFEDIDLDKLVLVLDQLLSGVEKND